MALPVNSLSPDAEPLPVRVRVSSVSIQLLEPKILVLLPSEPLAWCCRPFRIDFRIEERIVAPRRIIVSAGTSVPS